MMFLLLIFDIYMSTANWLLWFVSGMLSGGVILSMSTDLIMGAVGAGLMVALFLILGSFDYLGSRMNQLMK